MKIKKGYTFDDVLLVPKHSTIQSRGDVDLSVDLGKGVKLDIPIVSANMKTVTGPVMANTIAELGGLAILHRFSDTRVQDYKDSLFQEPNYETKNNRIAISVGVQENELNIIDELIPHGLKTVCVDVAHGDHINCINMVEKISNRYPELLLIAGNVATRKAAERLSLAGADVIKVGVGNGSVCSTRIETGNGVPQLTALESIYSTGEVTRELIEGGEFVTYHHNGGTNKFKIIADGGTRIAGDLIKGLCFSDCVMLGNLLAGTNEAPGDLVEVDGRQYKTYVGSSTHKVRHVEGVAGLVPTKGSVAGVIQVLMEGLRSGCSYQGVSNLTDLKKNPEFVEITNAGIIESRPHDILIK